MGKTKVLFKTALFFSAILTITGSWVRPEMAEAADISSCGVLNQANTTYVLLNDVASPGSCFFITASGITLDLNGHAVTYDNSSPIVVNNGSFESDLAGSWNLTNAANATRVAGTFVKPVTLFHGGYSLKVNVPTIDQSVVSMGTVTLAPNTRYSVSTMVYNQVSDGIVMSVELSETLRATQTGKTNRGFQYISKEFVTGPTQETYPIRLRVSGATAAVSGAIYFDDVKIQRNRLVGVMVGPVNWRNPPVASDSTAFGSALNVVVKNGRIVQGTGGSDWSPGLANETNSTVGHEFTGLNIVTRGANSKAIVMSQLQNGSIHHNVLAAPMPAITSRDNMHGTVLTADGTNNKIYNNTITQGVQGGIGSITTSGQIPNEIYGNEITLQSRYTNDFAISGNGSIIHDNIVNCGTGGNGCRGIFGGGQGTSGTKVYNNRIEVQELPLNQEYGFCQNYGAYGIQTENTSQTEIYGNTVTAYGGVCEAVAYRANPEEGLATASNNLVHDNVFTAIANGPARASALKLSGSKNSEISIYRNVFRTNRRWIFASFDKLIDNLTLTANRWETTGTLDSPFYPFENSNWQGSYVKDMVFLNNTYGPGDKERFESEYFRSTAAWPSAEPNCSFTVKSSVFVPAAPTTLRAL